MKKRIFLLSVIILGLITQNIFAKSKKRIVSSSVEFAIKTFNNAHLNGDIANYSEVLTNNVKFNLNRHGKVLSHGKEKELEFLKTKLNVVQNCDLSYQVIHKDNDIALVKVVMDYGDFERESYLNLVFDKGNWLIKEVTTTIK